jgi:hypothetical protein
MNWGNLFEHTLIGLVAALIWWLQRETKTRVEDVHTLVNHQRDELTAEIKRLTARVVVLQRKLDALNKTD